MINRIFISGFRNLENQTLELGAPIVLVTGLNGAGKTSFLEAIYTLLNGKSFRSSQTQHIVSKGASDLSFLLRAELVLNSNAHQTVALKKSSSEKYVAKIDADVVSSISELAAVMPTQIVEPKSFNLLDGGAGKRRRFLDWGVFHVEHRFSYAWKCYLACLKQRNSLLKRGEKDKKLIGSWDQQLAHYGEEITRYRLECFNNFEVELQTVMAELLPSNVIESTTVSFYQGWNKSISLSEALADNLDRDIKRRSTLIGPHRADIKISFGELPAVEGLSRGQQKLLALAFQLAYVALVVQHKSVAPLLLLDDVCSELDEANTIKLFKFLSDRGVNVIASALDSTLIGRVLEASNLVHKARMFHVEHGKISAIQY